MKEIENDNPVYTVKEFIKAYPMCKGTFYHLVKTNRAPRMMKVGRRVYITKEAALKWQREMEK